MRNWIVQLLLLASCGPDLQYRDPKRADPEDLSAQASHVFVGVIEEQEFDPYFRPSGMEGTYWWNLRRRVRVELMLKGVLSQPTVEVWEVFWVGGVPAKGTGSD
jgi:hypothetical protein